MIINYTPVRIWGIVKSAMRVRDELLDGRRDPKSSLRELKAYEGELCRIVRDLEEMSRDQSLGDIERKLVSSLLKIAREAFEEFRRLISEVLTIINR